MRSTRTAAPFSRRRPSRSLALLLAALCAAGPSPGLAADTPTEDAREMLTPKKREIYDRWVKEKIAIPAAAWEAPPFSKETIAAAQKVERLWRDSLGPLRQANDLFFGVKKMEGGWRDPRFRLPDDLSKKLEPFKLAFKELALSPGYSMEVLFHTRPANEWGELPIPNVGMIIDGARLCRMEMHLLGNRGNLTGELAPLETAIRASKASPYSPATCRITATAVAAIMAAAVVVPMGSFGQGVSPGSAVSEQAAQDFMAAVGEILMSNDANLSGMGSGDPWIASEELALLREYHRVGAAEKIESATRMELNAALWNAQASWLAIFALPAAKKAGSPESIAAMVMIIQGIAADFAPATAGMDGVVWTFLRSLDHPNEEMQVRAKVSLVKTRMMAPPKPPPATGAPPINKPVSARDPARDPQSS